MSANDTHVTSAIKNLPEAFRSASSSIDQTSEDSRRVSLRDTSYGMFYAAGWNGTWISGKEFMFSASDQSLNIYNMQANNSTQIFSADKMRTFSPYQTQLSSDKKYLLLKKTNFKVFRRSTYGTYDIISLENHHMLHLHPSNWSSKPGDSKFLIRYVSWAPQGNGLVYVDFNNNVSKTSLSILSSSYASSSFCCSMHLPEETIDGAVAAKSTTIKSQEELPDIVELLLLLPMVIFIK